MLLHCTQSTEHLHSRTNCSSFDYSHYSIHSELSHRKPLSITGLAFTFLHVLIASDSHYKSSAIAEMGDRGHNRHGLKRGEAAVPLSRGGGELGPRLTQCCLTSTSVPRGVFIHPAIWPPQTWAKNWVGWVCPFSGGSWVHIEHNVA